MTLVSDAAISQNQSLFSSAACLTEEMLQLMRLLAIL